MNKKVVTAIIIVILIGLGIYRGIQTSKPEVIKRTNYQMGTIVNLTLYDNNKKNINDVFKSSFDIINDIENEMSLNVDGSAINKINELAYNQNVKLSDDMYKVIKKSLEYSSQSDGKFDVTAGKLVQLWNIGGDNARLPSQNEIDEANEYVDYKYIELNDNDKTIKFTKPGLILDLGGIAKGYAADKVKDYLISQNIEKAIIDIGGDIYVVGTNESNQPWGIGIQNPFSDNRNNYIGSIKESNKSIVTSGVYERYFEENGKRYHHILDTTTGYPVENELMGVSIISKDSIDGDALSTAVFSLGLEDGMKLVNGINDVDAIFITKDKEVFLSDNIKSSFKIKDTSFKIKELN